MTDPNHDDDIQKAKEISNAILTKQHELMQKIADSSQKLDELRERTQELLHPPEQTDNNEKD